MAAGDAPSRYLLPKSMNELVAKRAAEQPDAPAFQTYLPGTTTLGTMTYSDAAKAVDHLCWHYHEAAGLGNSDPNDTAVVAVLIETGVWSFLTELALQKLGHTPLVLSTNNSVPAIANLLKKTEAKVAIYSDKFGDSIRDAVNQLKHEDGIDVSVVAQSVFDDRFRYDSKEKLVTPPFPARFSPDEEESRSAVILHSSGSTGFPKPIALSHLAVFATASGFTPRSSFTTAPTLHMFGHESIVCAFLAAKVVAVWPSHLPLSASNVCKFYNDLPEPPQQLFSVPYLLKMMSESDQGIATLKKFDVVNFAGAALPEDVGNYLDRAGVHLCSVFGSTEAGRLFLGTRDYEVDHDWAWLPVRADVSPYIRFEPVGDVFNIVVLPGWPSLVVSNRADGSYDTGDLFSRHPTDPNKIKYVGRIDDTLTHALGEKTNPIPIEDDICESPLVSEAIVFGDGRAQCGVIIIKAEDAPDDDEYIEAIWPAIVNANARAPTHSRILREMIRPIPYGTKIPRAAKLSILRRAAYKQFASLIDDTFNRLERGDEDRVSITDPDEMLAFVRQTIVTTLGRGHDSLGNEDDLFAEGLDSIKATTVRNTFVKKLNLGDGKLGQNVAYDHPSITKLSIFLLTLTTGGDNSVDDVGAEMNNMVERWVSKLVPPAPVTDQFESRGEVVVLTGATGSMGAHLLATLTERDDVAKVICLVRAADNVEARDRVEKSLDQHYRRAPYHKWTAYAAKLNSASLGLASNAYTMLCNTATAIIHLAWPVNFLLPLSSFDEHVGATVHLVNLALGSPRKVKPSFFFASSISTMVAQPGNGDNADVLEQFPTAPKSAQMGYGQGKWVAEKVLERAGQLGARATVLRIGQLVGDKNYHGAWSETEAWPLMFRSANTVSALPMLPDQPTWLPVDVAANAVADTLIATNRSASSADRQPHSRVYHIVNPEIAEWSVVLDGLRQGGLEFDTLSPDEWFDRLRSSSPDVTINPTYKLLDYYRDMIANVASGAKMPTFSTESTPSPSLSQTQAIDAYIVSRWVDAWAETGFLRIRGRAKKRGVSNGEANGGAVTLDWEQLTFCK